MKTKKSIKKDTNTDKLPGQSKSQPPHAPFPVVGIGASAGGIEAIMNLLSNLSPDLGMAYVIVQHLSPEHKSILPELLEKKTAMKVHQVTDGIKIEANNVYVIPQATYMIIVDGHLSLSGRSRADKRIPVIDHFLETLANVYQNTAIAVILSGIGSDGTAGVQAIKANGGITFAQDDTALFQGMTRNAYESGYVDFVMSPAAIAKELASFASHDYTKFGSLDKLETNKRELKKIQSLLYNTSGVDFSQYKQTTIDRRIMRRMALNRQKSLEDYNRYLRANPAEADLLYRDLLINVTCFFREPAVLNVLKKRIFPQLFKNRKPSDTIRIWIPACASGEEVGSMAIALFAYLGEKALGTSIQIFGTDLSETAIDKARAGIYPITALQNLPAALIKQYFLKIDGRYQIIKPLRDICIFATHNLLKDPPFSKIDLISCQNVMIYLGATAQKKILQAFHYALKPSSYLILGKSESVGSETEMFETVDKEHKIYTNRAVNTHLPFDFFSRPQKLSSNETVNQNEKIPVSRPDLDIEKETDKILLSKYVPASILVNKDLQIVRFNGPVNTYLQPAAGKASLHLLKMVKDELIFELRGLIQRAKTEGIAAKKEGLNLNQDGQNETIIEVTPIKFSAEALYFLIVFCETNPGLAGPDKSESVSATTTFDQKQKRINLLENELKEARAHMKSMNEEFEATREELQSANEEILSTNEELQSINEELETSKEELQSTNEELITINEELQLRNHDLKESVDYTQGIVETIREPLIVLTRDLRIKTANKAFYATFRMLKDDVEGYNLKDIGNRMFHSQELKKQLKLIIEKGIAFQNFEVRSRFSFLGDRVLLFNAMRMSGDNDSQMRILLAIEDITETKVNEQDKANLIDRLAGEQERLNVILNNMPAGIIIVDDKEQVVFSNSAARHILGDQEFINLFGINETLKGVRVQDKEVIIMVDNQTRYLSLNTVRIVDTETETKLAVVNFIDISRRKKEEEQLKSAQENLNVALEAAQMGVWDLNIETGRFRRSHRYDQLMGFDSLAAEAKLNDSFKNLVDEDKDLLANAFSELAQSGKMNIEFRVCHKNSIRWISVFGRAFYNSTGDPVQAAGVSFDVTDRKLSDNHKDEFIAIASHELKTPITSISSYTELLKDMVEEENIGSAKEILPRLGAQVERLTGLVTDLLDVTKINEGQMKLHREKIDINELIKKSVGEIQRTLKKHQLQLNLQPCPQVLADVNRIEQVVLNLISNAVKYSPEAAKIDISTRKSEDKVVVSIQDFGIGMPEVTRKKVFERFFRDNDNTIPTSPGMGLGLFIAADIIKRHGGEIWVESEQGKGSIFYFSLPVPL
ncbi:chemotaxis protein CheB [Flavitalea sp.]|nr:chemotaxis protein CheB [Flavitalea sp.]